MARVEYQNVPALPRTALLDAASLLQRIEVSAPYFALRDVRLVADGIATATVDREYAMGLEAGVISTAEAGRHMAILGSIAAASLQPTSERHFYLAHRARVAAFRVSPGADLSGRGLRVSAQATLQRRTARAETRITLPNGEPLFVMTVEYKVMVDHLFMRFVAKPGMPACEPLPVAGIDAPALALADVQRFHEQEARAELTVRAFDCAGHFAGCPALPVAKLMHALALVAGSVLKPLDDRSERPSYQPELAEIEADSLAFAGERLALHAVLESRDPRAAVVRVAAHTDANVRVGAGRFTMRPCVG
jgi:hypothetical protein